MRNIWHNIWSPPVHFCKQLYVKYSKIYTICFRYTRNVIEKFTCAGPSWFWIRRHKWKSRSCVSKLIKLPISRNIAKGWSIHDKCMLWDFTSHRFISSWFQYRIEWSDSSGGTAEYPASSRSNSWTLPDQKLQQVAKVPFHRKFVIHFKHFCTNKFTHKYSNCDWWQFKNRNISI